jgi:hypothetical protein
MARGEKPEKKGGKIMNKKPRLGPDSPLVQEALAGIYRSGRKIFFRINPENGHHKKISVSKALNVLDIPYENKVDLIHTFPFPELAYSSQRMQVNAAATAKRIARHAGADDNDDTEELEEATLPKNCRYHLVEQNNGMHGCYDGQDGGLVLFKSLPEAKEYIHNLLHHRESLTLFYGGKKNNND